MKSIILLLATLLICSTAGCQQRMINKLQGHWEGHPDSASKRRERDAVKYGDEVPTSEAATEASGAVQVTDWEDYDVALELNFLNSERLEMTLEGQEKVAGSWQIVSKTPAGCTIEVQTKADEADGIVRRRFDLLLDERDGTCVGFQLTETGADPQVGALYFQRPSS